MEPTESPRGTKRPLPASTAGDEDDDGAGRAAPGERKPRFPKGKKAKNRDPGAADADAGGSGEGGAAAEDIDSLMNPELAAVRRARRRHRREAEDTQGAAADVRGFEIIQALKKLKSTSTDKRGKMTEGTKRMFDELTEAAMKLMENGEYNVYSDDRETFEREAEGYERLACARLGVPEVEDIFVDTAEDNQTTSSLLEMDSGPSAANTSTTTATSNDDGSNFDMFGDNDDISDVNRDSDAKTVNSGSNPEPAPQNASGTSVAEIDNGSVDSDYVFDLTSGYYYSSSTGYYYDLTSGCYCSASTGTWYSYDEQTGAYKEIQDWWHA